MLQERWSTGMRRQQANDLTLKGHWFRIWMPYCFVELKLEGKKKVYLPLNRNYKPLGISFRNHVNYEKFRNQAVIFKSDPTTFKDIWYDFNGEPNDVHLWLYEDAYTSRVDYFERLERLVLKTMKLVVEHESD
jgi:hypothetical protein